MVHMALFRCDCCGLEVDLAQSEVCPRCQYPVHPEKERQFLERSLYDLRRVVQYGGASLTIAGLVARYERRLHVLLRAGAQPSEPRPAPAPSPAPAQAPETISRPVPPAPGPAAGLNQQKVPTGPLPAPFRPTISVQPAASLRGFSFSSDAVVNILATLGSFLLLAGSLGFVLTTPNLWVSFLGMFVLHALFGSASLFTHRRFPHLRAVSTIYTLIFALLVPLVGFSAYRLVTNDLVALSVPVLLTLAALYAACAYGVLAVAQRFVPFAYLGVVSLLVGDLALAQALHLAYWWWPCVALPLALVGLVALPRPSGSEWLLTEERAILRSPLLVLMYMVIWVATLAVLLFLLWSLSLDAQGQPVQQAHLALFTFASLLFVWTILWARGTNNARVVPALYYLLLGVLLLLGYALNLDHTGYVLLLAGIVLAYHVAARRLTIHNALSLALDQLTIGISALVMLLVAWMTPLELLSRAFAHSSNFFFSGLLFSFSPVSDAKSGLELLALCICLGITLSLALVRAGSSRVPAQAGWCWLLLLSGLLLASAYGQVVLLWPVSPFWAFLVLSLLLLSGAFLLRRVASAAWANPLDLLTLGSIGFTLVLGLGQTRAVISTCLLGFAALLYLVLLVQRRPLPTPLCAMLLMLALPLLWDHPLLIFGLSLLLPLLAAGIQRAGLFGDRTGSQESLFAWTLLVPALLAGLILTVSESAGGQNLPLWSGLQLTLAYEGAVLGLAWYVAAAVGRMKISLVPAVLFWLLAILQPSNNFWVMSVLTLLLAVLSALIERRMGGAWALPLALAAIFSASMVPYTGLLHQQVTATGWLLLGFAFLAYGLGLWTEHPSVFWLTPFFAVPAVFLAASVQGDLYRPPLVALTCAGLGLLCSRSSWPILARRQRSALPLCTTALLVAAMSGVLGSLSNLNRPFYGALPTTLLLYALVAFAVVWIEKWPRWNWLVAVFALWGVLLARQLSPFYMLSAGTALAFLGLVSGRLAGRSQATVETGSVWRVPVLSWNWPWYSAFLVAALLLGTWSFTSQQTQLIVGSMVVCIALAVIVTLIERVPAFLVFPALLAAWTIALWLPGPDPVPDILAYTFLCVLVFAAQFVWRVWPPAVRRPPESILYDALALGGLCLVVLSACSQGALSPNDGSLVQAGALALATLSVLLFLCGLTYPATVARMPGAGEDEAQRVRRLEMARAVQHWSYAISGLLFSLVVSWELLAFHQTRFDVLTLVPASYLILLAPFLLRDQTLPEQHIVGQAVAFIGAALLLLPSLWFSFHGADLLPTLILLTEAVALLILGLVIRLRIFILSSAALVVVGTLRLLFLSIPPSLPVLLMGFGGVLIAVATLLILSRNRLQRAWRAWN